MDISYIARRLQSAQAMAARAVNDCARIPHLEMVRRYKMRLALLTPPTRAMMPELILAPAALAAAHRRVEPVLSA